MIQRCRDCGVIAGGLISTPPVPEPAPWPEVDLCPNCVIKTVAVPPVAFCEATVGGEVHFWC